MACASTLYSVSSLYATIKCSNVTTFCLPAIQRAYVSSSTPGQRGACARNLPILKLRCMCFNNRIILETMYSAVANAWRQIKEFYSSPGILRKSSSWITTSGKWNCIGSCCVYQKFGSKIICGDTGESRGWFSSSMLSEVLKAVRYMQNWMCQLQMCINTPACELQL